MTMSEASRELLSTIIGRQVPESGPLCLTRVERRELGRYIDDQMGRPNNPGLMMRVTEFGGEEIVVCE